MKGREGEREEWRKGKREEGTIKTLFTLVTAGLLQDAFSVLETF